MYVNDILLYWQVLLLGKIQFIKQVNKESVFGKKRIEQIETKA